MQIQKTLPKQQKTSLELCESIVELPTATRLHKLLQKRRGTRVDALRLPNNSFTANEVKTPEGGGALPWIYDPWKDSRRLVSPEATSDDWKLANKAVTFDFTFTDYLNWFLVQYLLIL